LLPLVLTMVRGPLQKKPDLSDLTSKFDLDKILGGIKSMINPEGATPDVDPDDALGMKIAQLSALFQEMSKAQLQLAQDFTKANDTLNGLFKDLEALRESMASPKEKPKYEAETKSAPKLKPTEKPTENVSSKPKAPEEENKNE